MGVDVPKILIKGLEVADKAINKDGEDIDEGEWSPSIFVEEDYGYY